MNSYVNLSFKRQQWLNNIIKLYYGKNYLPGYKFFNAFQHLHPVH